jgi:hypothetical protein
MGQLRPPKPVKFFCGLLATRSDWLEEGRRALEADVGPIESISEAWPFEFTKYYDAEMGAPLIRQFVSFASAEPPARLPRMKQMTNEAEQRAADRFTSVRRPLNLDPGYVALDKLVLATTKDFSHRLYLGDGIFGEVTLRFQGGGWRAWPWTYPDYAAPTYHPFFTSVRATLAQQIKKEETPE